MNLAHRWNEAQRRILDDVLSDLNDSKATTSLALAARHGLPVGEALGLAAMFLVTAAAMGRASTTPPMLTNSEMFGTTGIAIPVVERLFEAACTAGLVHADDHSALSAAEFLVAAAGGSPQPPTSHSVPQGHTSTRQ